MKIPGIFCSWKPLIHQIFSCFFPLIHQFFCFKTLLIVLIFYYKIPRILQIFFCLTLPCLLILWISWNKSIKDQKSWKYLEFMEVEILLFIKFFPVLFLLFIKFLVVRFLDLLKFFVVWFFLFIEFLVISLKKYSRLKKLKKIPEIFSCWTPLIYQFFYCLTHLINIIFS